MSLIERLEALASKATPRLWRMEGDELCNEDYQIATIWEADESDPDSAASCDAALIVELVNNLPTILSALRAQEQSNAD